MYLKKQRVQLEGPGDFWHRHRQADRLDPSWDGTEVCGWVVHGQCLQGQQDRLRFWFLLDCAVRSAAWMKVR